MVSFDQAVATVSEKISQQQPADHAAPTVVDKFVDESLVGHVIAQDVFAAENVPAFRASIVDGYAVIGEITGAVGERKTKQRRIGLTQLLYF